MVDPMHREQGMSDLKVGEGARTESSACEASGAHSFGISRRTLVKGSVIAGAAVVITSKKTAVFAQEYPGVPAAPNPPTSCDPEPTNSPPTTPFVDDLPIPAAAQQAQLFPFPTKNANTGAGEAARAPHQRWEEF